MSTSTILLVIWILTTVIWVDLRTQAIYKHRGEVTSSDLFFNLVLAIPLAILFVGVFTHTFISMLIQQRKKR